MNMGGGLLRWKNYYVEGPMETETERFGGGKLAQSRTIARSRKGQTKKDQNG